MPVSRKSPQLKPLPDNSHKGKPRHYGGLLRKPNTIQISQLLAQAGKPLWYPGTQQAWDAVVWRIRRREAREWQRRYLALAAFYDITIDKGPDDTDCWHQLALALAAAHVPAFACGSLRASQHEFRAKAVGRRPVQLQRNSTLIFAMLVCLALQEGLTTRHKIARYVSKNATKSSLMKIWKPKVIKDYRSGLRSIPFETAKYLIPQLCNAWRDVLSGKANTFQYQVVVVAIQLRTSPPNVERVWQWVFGLYPKATKANSKANLIPL